MFQAHVKTGSHDPDYINLKHTGRGFGGYVWEWNIPVTIIILPRLGRGISIGRKCLEPGHPAGTHKEREAGPYVSTQ